MNMMILSLQTKSNLVNSLIIIALVFIIILHRGESMTIVLFKIWK
jgi:hypothetical protein